MQKNVDHGDVLFTGLSKALKLIHDYFSTKKERVKVKDAYSSSKGVFYGIPYLGSILGPLLFNIHLCDLFHFLEDSEIASYADDTTIHMVNKKKRISQQCTRSIFIAPLWMV